MTTVSDPHQARGGGLEVGELRQHVYGPINMEPSTPASVMVRYHLSTYGPPHADCPLNIGFVSAVYW